MSHDNSSDLVSGFKFQDSRAEGQASGSRFQDSGSWFQVLDARDWTSFEGSDEFTYCFAQIVAIII